MKKILIIFSCFLIVTQILTANEIEKKDEIFTSKEYKDISKDAIFEAAKKVFILAGDNEFRLDSYRNKLVASRTKMTYIPLLPLTHEDFWELSIEEENNISKAKLKLYRINDFDKDDITYPSTRVHDLLWNRIDYLLGLNDSWSFCITGWDFAGTLCDFIDLNIINSVRDEDIVKDIYIVDRKASKSVNEIDEDVLSDDIELSIEDSKEDILEKDNNDTLDENMDNKENEEFDKEIEELDKKVNENIDLNLDKIKEEKASDIELPKE